jgi:hypothetical protein
MAPQSLESIAGTAFYSLKVEIFTALGLCNVLLTMGVFLFSLLFSRRADQIEKDRLEKLKTIAVNDIPGTIRNAPAPNWLSPILVTLVCMFGIGLLAWKKLPQPVEPSPSDQGTLAAVGVFFILGVVCIALAVPTPTEFQSKVFRGTLALGAAAFASQLPGMLEVHIGNNVTAGGALAVAVLFLTWWKDPAGFGPKRTNSNRRQGGRK